MNTDADKKRKNNDYKYTKLSTVGYFGLGAVTFCAGFVYALLNNDNMSFYSLIRIMMEVLSVNWRELILAVSGTAFFYWAFFCIRKGMKSISDKYNGETENEHVTETLQLREKCEEIIKKKNSDERINEQDIEKVENQNIKNALKEWFRINQKIKWIFWGYIIYGVVVLVFVVFRSEYFPWFFITYTLLFLFSTCFYATLFSKLYFRSFTRLSYGILYPTILSIAVNLYFGLSVSALCIEKPLISVFIPIIIFALFFIIIAVFEILSYRKESGPADKFSARGFVGTSVILLGISITGFIVLANSDILSENYINAISNQLFAIAFSLFLGIFEGWDAISQMHLDENGPIFTNNYRWWNFLQVCYPLVFFFLMGAVSSEIFTFGLMIVFTIMSIASTFVWKRGGEKEEYRFNPWRKLKLGFGLSTILFIFVNRLVFMNEWSHLKTPPESLNTNDINVELILFFIGLISSICILIGDVKEQKKIVIMALPFTNTDGYKGFTDFYKYGYIYDLSNYIYLFYILVAHILLFSTNLIPKSSEQFESASTILVIFIVIIYMILSFHAKIISIDKMTEKTEISE